MARETAEGKWYVVYEDGKPVRCGFSPMKGAVVKRFDDLDADILAEVTAARKAKKRAKKAARRDAVTKLATAAGLTAEEAAMLFGG